MTTPAVKADLVAVRFGDVEAIGPSDLDLPAGCLAAVIGPNGSGKSTLLNLVSGLATPSAGSIEVLGTSALKARPDVAYVLQSTKVNEAMPVTVEEVVGMGRFANRRPFGRLDEADRAAVSDVLERLELSGLARRHLPELSGGERQRVFVAQGVVQDHRLLLLDEPLTGLDLLSTEIIADIVTDECRLGRTVVMTTHDLAEAAAADHVVLMSRRVVASGPPSEVLTAEHLSDAYGARILQLPDGQIFIDDPAHLPVPGRHVHGERIIHTEAPGSRLHDDAGGNTP